MTVAIQMLLTQDFRPEINSCFSNDYTTRMQLCGMCNLSQNVVLVKYFVEG